MATIGYVQNGVKRRKKRNGTSARTRTVKAKNPAKRRSVGLASVKSFAKRNGLKLVSKSAANPKRKRHHKKRRNGLVTASSYTARNGILGNSKRDARQVGVLLGGMGLTKLGSKLLAPFVNPILARVGVGEYSDIITDGVMALMVLPFAASKIGNADDVKHVRLGGLAIVGIDLIEKFAPSGLKTFIPFNTSPVVIAGNQVAVAPSAVTKLVNDTSATPAEKAAVSGAMRQLERATGARLASSSEGGMNRNTRRPFPMSVQ